MFAKLTVIAGANKGDTFELADNAKVVIGRSDKADLRINDPSVSRAHCTLECAGGKAVLRDTNSSTGTRVAGKAITSHVLKTGDTFEIGESKLRFLTAAAGAPAPRAVEEPEETTPEQLRKLTGTKLAHFHIGDVVAVGNSGVVFQARDTKDNRDVALKVYLPEFARSEEDLQRFIRAVKTMLPMRHRNLVSLYGGGKTGPYCWMSMEYVEGESLTQTIARIGKEGKLDWRPALNVAVSVGNGLYYLHAEKIIYRNLTPGNVLLSRMGVVKLGSMILAKALSGALAKDVTLGGEVLGDVRYQAPEQLGAGGPVDGRADIYSLGALVYALLTGKPPFEAKTVVDTAALILRRQPAPPSQFNPHIPERLEEIVLSMLAKKQEDRIQSAAELLEELEKLPKF